MKNLKTIALEILKRTYGANLTISQVKEIFTIINEQPTMYKAEEVVLNLTR